MTDTEIERIEALMREATPGPWKWYEDGTEDRFARLCGGIGNASFDSVEDEGYFTQANARLIAAAINALPDLLAERKELLRRVEEAEARQRFLLSCPWCPHRFDEEASTTERTRHLIGCGDALRAQLAEAQAVLALRGVRPG